MARTKSRTGQFRRTIRKRYGSERAAAAERCVQHVKASGRSVNPFAVCSASIAGSTVAI